MRTTTVFAISLLALTAFPAIWCFKFDAETIVLTSCLLHGIMGAILTTLLAMLLCKAKVPFFMSGATLATMIMVLYFNTSGLKYLVPPVYPVFQESTLERLAGSSIVFVSLILIITIVALMMNKGTWAEEIRKKHSRVFSLPMVHRAYWMSLPIHLIYAYIVLRHPEAIDDPMHRSYLLSAFIQVGAINMFAHVFTASWILVARRDGQTSPHIRIAPLLSVTLTVLLGALIEARHIVLFSLIMLTFATMTHRRQLRTTGFLAIYLGVPIAGSLAIAGFTQLMRQRAGEYFDTFYDNITAITYRSDLSDFAWSVSRELPDDGAGLMLFSDAIISSVPRVILPQKFSIIEDSSEATMERIGWPSPDHVDYPDTYFSTAALAFGIPGILLIPPLLILVICIIDRAISWLTVQNGLNPLGVIIFASGFIRIEADAINYLPYVRTVTMMAIAYVAIGLLLKLLMHDEKLRHVITSYDRNQ